MTLIEYNTIDDDLPPRQRWSIYISYILIGITLYFGILLRDTSLNQTNTYTNLEAGITASYPSDWLLDESDSYVFRVRDMAKLGFKTTIQVSVLPVNADMVERNVLDRLSLNRSQTLIDYNVLDYSNIILADETPAFTMLYSFVSRDASPFLEGISSVVLGRDILTIQRGQAVIVSFRAETSIYEKEEAIFEQFIEKLDF